MGMGRREGRGGEKIGGGVLGRYASGLAICFVRVVLHADKSTPPGAKENA